ncbi:CoA-transferase family III domain-containing protein [Hyaloraphidium curvatum]|nr:CoA-transferase family III domain-containing protein [Hyaloraphidium curvatum]
MAVDIHAGARGAASILLNQLGFAGDAEAKSYADAVEITGSRTDPWVPAPFKIMEEATGIQVAVATVMNKLTKLKYGKAQSAKVSTDHAALTMAAPYLTHVNGEDYVKVSVDWEKGPEAPAAQDFRFLYANVYPTKDNSWIYLNAKFDSTKKLLTNLGFTQAENDLMHQLVKTDRPRFFKMMTEKVRSWDSHALEERMNANHHVAVANMDRAKWDASEQGKAIAPYPFIEVDAIPNPSGSAGAWKPTPLPRDTARTNPPQLLEGLKVVEIARILAGPKAGTFLASMGAQVVKVQSPVLEDIPTLGYDTQVGKRSIFLDLKDNTDRATLTAMIKDADVVIQNYAYGALDRLGFGPKQVAEMVKDRDRGIIYVQSNCFGFHGPMAPNPGFDPLAQMVTGIHAEMAKFQLYDPKPPFGEHMPTSIAFPVCDLSTAQFSALGVLTALLRRATVGGSYLVQTSLTQAALFIQAVGKYPDDVTRKIFSALPPRQPYYMQTPVYGTLLAVKYLPKVRPELYDEKLYTEDRQSPYGTVKYLNQPLQLGTTPLRYRWSPRPFGYDKVKAFVDPPEDAGASAGAGARL